MVHIPFIKMHGAGNDFVIIDARNETLNFTAEQIALVSDRHRGVGCDQFIVVKNSTQAEAFMHIFNADGSRSGACGNATRCLAFLLMEEMQKSEIYIETQAGVLMATRTEDGRVMVDMGIPRLEWQDIPLAVEQDTLHVDIGLENLTDPVAVSMGNPHVVFFVPDIKTVDLHRLGPRLEHHKLLPERANIGIAQVKSSHAIFLRVWERGAGETLACGSGACAAVVAASRRKLINREADVHLPGGVLNIRWRDNEHVMMTGPVAVSFTGVFEISDQ